MNDYRDPVTRRNIRLTVAAALIFALGAMAALMYKLSQPRILNAYELREQRVYVLDPPPAVQPLALIDHRGLPFTRERLRGHWTLAFFGFTSCADICPATMATLARMYRELKPAEQADLQILLITVDPARDTQEVLGAYAAGFHPDFLGVTGEPARLRKLALEWQSGFEPAAAGVADYQVEHSGNLVLVNPQGEVHAFLRPPFEHGALRVVWRSLRATY
ncbi:MAG: SCO family protein [Porticoccaceae bacterium]|jgi:protein SCO1/2|nr:SCO family protein [Porticoccaceae bacterium]